MVSGYKHYLGRLIELRETIVLGEKRKTKNEIPIVGTDPEKIAKDLNHRCLLESRTILGLIENAAASVKLDALVRMSIGASFFEAATEKSVELLLRAKRGSARSYEPAALEAPVLPSVRTTELDQSSNVTDIVRAVLAEHPNGLSTKDLLTHVRLLRPDVIPQTLYGALNNLLRPPRPGRSAEIGREGSGRRYVYRLIAHAVAAAKGEGAMN